MKKIKPFRFKQFEVFDQNSSMRIGTDAMLLGAWTTVNSAQNVLEIGSGSGVISLMLAQRNSSAKYVGIDIHQDSVLEANKNAQNSPWKVNIEFRNIALQSFESDMKFDLIVSNPPFFDKKTASNLPKSSRTNARTQGTLNWESLFTHSKRLLTPKGKLSIVAPYLSLDSIKSALDTNNFFIHKQLNVRSFIDSKIERVLLEIGFENLELTETALYIYKAVREYSDSYRILTKDYHTIF